MNEKNTIRSEIRAASRVTERTMETAIVRGDPSETRTARRIRAAASVALYWSLPGEVFTHDLVERWSRSKRIYLPVMQGDGLILKRFTDRNDLREARFGVQEPITGETAGPGDMELIVVPGRSLRPARKPARARQGLLRPAASRAGSFESGRLFRLPDAGTHTLRSARRRHGLARVRIGPERRADRMPQAEKRNGPERLNVPLDRRRTARTERACPRHGSCRRMVRKRNAATAAKSRRRDACARVRQGVRSARPAGGKDGLFPKNGYLCMLSLRARATEAQPAKAERPQNDKTETTWT